MHAVGSVHPVSSITSPHSIESIILRVRICANPLFTQRAEKGGFSLYVADYWWIVPSSVWAKKNISELGVKPSISVVIESSA